MFMTDEEISTSYRQAKDREAQVKVLAELNGTDRHAMEVKLQALGLREMKEGRKEGRRAPSIDEGRALALLSEGGSDLEVAEMLGCSQAAFAAWRRKRGLPPNRKPFKGGKKPAAAEPKPREDTSRGAMLVGQLARILDVVEAGHPDAVVLLDGRRLCSAEIYIRMDAAGAVLEKQLLLKTEGIT